MQNGEFKKICKEINNQIEPRQDFLNNLKENISQKIDEEKCKKSKKSYLPKVAVAFLTVGIVSTSVFGKDIGLLITKMFSNIDKGLQMATENGYIQEINSGYVTDQGIGIKIENIIVDENVLNITFNIKAENCDDVYFDDIKLINENKIIYPSTETIDNIKHNISRKHSIKSVNKNNIIVTETFYDIENNFSEYKNLHLNIEEIAFFNLNDEENIIKGNWDFELNVDENILNRNSQRFVLEDNNIVEKYDIELNNTGLSVILVLKDNLDNLTKEDIVLKGNNGESYICSDFCMIGKNEINMIFSVTNFDNVNEFDLRVKDIILKINKE